MSLRLHHDANPSDPERMTPEDRRDEVAGIFARGVMRLHARTLPHVHAEPGADDAPEASLDLSASPRPCVRAG